MCQCLCQCVVCQFVSACTIRSKRARITHQETGLWADFKRMDWMPVHETPKDEEDARLIGLSVAQQEMHKRGTGGRQVEKDFFDRR